MSITSTKLGSSPSPDGGAGQMGTAYGSLIKNSTSGIDTTISNGTNFFDVSAVTVSVELNNFTMPANMKLKYIGADLTKFRITTEISGRRASGSGATVYSFIYIKNGVEMDSGSAVRNHANQSEYVTIVISRDMDLSQNDEIIMGVQNGSSVNWETSSAFMYVEAL